MIEQRWISRSIVNLLINTKDYKAAAEVVSGSIDVFGCCSRKIAAAIESVEEASTAVSILNLQLALDEARKEIAGHREWQNEVLGKLPRRDDEDGLTGPLRQMFAKSAISRNRLLQQVMAMQDEYFRMTTKS